MKEPKPKKTLEEEMRERIKSMADARREKVEAEKREQYREQEDAMMEIIAGPEWRSRYPGDPDDGLSKAS